MRKGHDSSLLGNKLIRAFVAAGTAGRGTDNNPILPILVC